jgi:hypothetical protein
MLKCGKAEVRRLKTALRLRLPAAQRQHIQMVLLRESGIACEAAGDFCWIPQARRSCFFAG